MSVFDSETESSWGKMRVERILWSAAYLPLQRSCWLQARCFFVTEGLWRTSPGPSGSPPPHSRQHRPPSFKRGVHREGPSRAEFRGFREHGFPQCEGLLHLTDMSSDVYGRQLPALCPFSLICFSSFFFAPYVHALSKDIYSTCVCYVIRHLCAQSSSFSFHFLLLLRSSAFFLQSCPIFCASIHRRLIPLLSVPSPSFGFVWSEEDWMIKAFNAESLRQKLFERSIPFISEEK